MPEDSTAGPLRLAALANALGRALTPTGQDLVTTIADAARAVFGATGCSIALVTPAGDEVVFTTVSGGAEESVTGLTMPIAEGIVGWVATTGQAVAVTDLAHDPRFSATVASQTGYTPTTILACPVETDERLLGVIEVLDRDEARAGADQDLHLLSLFARQAALAIDANARNYQIGELLLRAFVDEGHSELAAALERQHDDDLLNEVAAAFAQLAAIGPAEKQLAVDLLRDVTRYASRRRR